MRGHRATGRPQARTDGRTEAIAEVRQHGRGADARSTDPGKLKMVNGSDPVLASSTYIFRIQICRTPISMHIHRMRRTIGPKMSKSGCVRSRTLGCARAHATWLGLVYLLYKLRAAQRVIRGHATWTLGGPDTNFGPNSIFGTHIFRTHSKKTDKGPSPRP